MIYPLKVAPQPSIHQDNKINTAIIIVLDTTTFLMDLDKHSKDLNPFLTFDGSYTLQTQRRGGQHEIECDLF